MAVPVYIAEIAPPNLRGGMGSIFQLAVTLGVLFIYAIGAPIDGSVVLRAPWQHTKEFLGLRI